MTNYSVSEARKQLPAIIDEVESGEPVELTRHGKTVAVLVSAEDYARLRKRRPSFAEAYAEFRKEFPEGELDLPPDYWDSLRDRSPGREVNL